MSNTEHSKQIGSTTMGGDGMRAAPGSRRRALRRACFVLAALVGLLALVGPSLAPAQAQTDDPEAGRPTAFIADAESYATQFVFNTSPPQFFAEILNVRSPWATSHFETGTTSNAKASLLNPGLAVTGIATVCAVGLPCDKIPNFPPPYPLMADANYPVAPDASAQISGGDVVAGPLITTQGDARAHAGRDKVTADAKVGGQRIGNTTAPLVVVGSSTAANDLSFTGDGSLVATAKAAANDINVLGTLHIDSVEASSVSTTNADGTQVNDVHLDIQGATLAGVPITIGNDGLALGGPGQGGSALSQLGKVLSPALSAFRGNVRTLGTTDTKDESGATGSATGLAIDLFPNTDVVAGQNIGVSPLVTILIGFAGTHSYTFQSAPAAPKSTGVSAAGSTGTGGTSTPGTPGTPGRPAVPGTTSKSTNTKGSGNAVEEITTLLLSGSAADRMKLFYLAWTLSLIGLALGSRLRPARLIGGSHGAPR